MESVDLVHDLIYDTENLQLAENTDIEESVISSGQEKRALLKKTKIVKQTWSIFEIYDKGYQVLLKLYQNQGRIY